MKPLPIVLLAVVALGGIRYWCSLGPPASAADSRGSLGPETGRRGEVEARDGEVERAAGGDVEATPRHEVAEGLLDSARGELASVASPLAAGVVLDESGTGIAGVDAFFEAHSDGVALVARSGNEGEFRFAIDDPGMLHAASTAYAPLARTRVAPGTKNAKVLVAPSGPVAGRIVDPAGRALAGARILAQTTLDTRRGWGERGPDLVPCTWETETDGHGAFALEGVAESSGRYVSVSQQGYVTEHVLLMVPFPRDLVVTLHPSQAAGLFGRVVDPEMRALEGAIVACGEITVETDERGGFFLDPQPEEGLPRKVHALHRGFLPAEREVDDASLSAGLEILFVLEEGELRISGTVVDENGRPVSAATVWSFDRTSLGVRDLEDGALVVSEMVAAEAVLGGQSGTTTDASGRFELRGLVDRALQRARHHVRPSHRFRLGNISRKWSCVPRRSRRGRPR